MRYALVLSLLLLGGCTPPPPPVVDGNVIGYWHGQRWQSSARVLWLSHYAADGTLDIEFFTCYAGKRMSRLQQFGRGEFTDGVLHTTLTRIIYDDGNEWVAGEDDEDEDGEPDEAQELSYRMLALDDESMSYESIEFGNRYSADRVGDDFALQCPPAPSTVDTSPGGRTGTNAWIRRGVDDDEDQEDNAAEDLRDALGGETPTED